MLRRGAVQCVVGLCRGRRGSSLRRIRALQEVSGMWSFCALSKHLPAVPALPPLPVASASGSLVYRLGPAIVSGSITLTLPLCVCLPRPVRLGQSKMSSRNWAFVWCNSFLEIWKEFSLFKLFWRQQWKHFAVSSRHFFQTSRHLKLSQRRICQGSSSNI